MPDSVKDDEPNEFESSAEENYENTDPSENDDHAIASLSKRLQESENSRKEERFMFVIVITVLLDATILSTTSAWTTPILVGLLELVGLAIYARQCGVEEVEKFADKILFFVKEKK